MTRLDELEIELRIDGLMEQRRQEIEAERLQAHQFGRSVGRIEARQDWLRRRWVDRVCWFILGAFAFWVIWKMPWGF